MLITPEKRMEKLQESTTQSLVKIEVIGRLLDEHTLQDAKEFSKISDDFDTVSSKLDNLLVATTRIATLQDIAKDAGAIAGKKTATIWTLCITVGLTVLGHIFHFIFPSL